MKHTDLQNHDLMSAVVFEITVVNFKVVLPFMDQTMLGLVKVFFKIVYRYFSTIEDSLDKGGAKS